MAFSGHTEAAFKIAENMGPSEEDKHEDVERETEKHREKHFIKDRQIQEEFIGPNIRHQYNDRTDFSLNPMPSAGSNAGDRNVGEPGFIGFKIREIAGEPDVFPV